MAETREYAKIQFIPPLHKPSTDQNKVSNNNNQAKTVTKSDASRIKDLDQLD